VSGLSDRGDHDRTLAQPTAADAIHLAKTRGCGAFATFDRRLAKVAKKLCDIEVRTL